MLMAFRNGRRMSALEAGRGAIGTCPWTRLQVKACVGPKTHFWAYEGGRPSFENGYEIDTPWHRSWKSLVNEAACEAIVEDKYLTDIYVAGDHVVELQKEPMTEDTVQKKLKFFSEVFDERIIYLLDISDFWQTRFKLGERTGNNKYVVDWKPKRPWIMALAKSKQCHVYLDYNYNSDKLLKIWVFKSRVYASFLSKLEFVTEFMTPVLKPEFVSVSASRLMVELSNSD